MFRHYTLEYTIRNGENNSQEVNEINFERQTTNLLLLLICVIQRAESAV